MSDIKKGDDVTWSSHGGTAEGTVKKIVEKDGTVDGHKYRASEDEPKAIIDTEHGRDAAHNLDSLKKA